MLFVQVLFWVALLHRMGECILLTTNQRIADFNYPVETHTTETSDGYVLTMFRIPYSPKLQNQDKYRPVIFMLHGYLCSSDDWVISGPEKGFAFVAADAGYDVWLGNARGNVYSRMNIHKSPQSRSFWDFDWHEIGVYDLPATIDFILDHTNQTALHYVGHSQGTTAYFVCLSENPEYNKKIKTGHMLAPVAYMKNLKSPVFRVLAPIFGHPSRLTSFIESYEFLPNNEIASVIGSKHCADSSPLQVLCADIIFLLAGFGSHHFNNSLLPVIVESHPAGTSSNQLFHFLQEEESGYFRQYDHGKIKNRVKYGQAKPPEYVVKNVVAPTSFYYSDNDWLAAVVDVEKMAGLLPNLVESFHVPYPDWNHLDFLWGKDAKELLYDRIIQSANHYEETQSQEH